jgi:hypothetical protein
MHFPRWLAHVNKRVFNPIEERRGARPVLIHTRDASGRDGPDRFGCVSGWGGSGVTL